VSDGIKGDTRILSPNFVSHETSSRFGIPDLSDFSVAQGFTPGKMEGGSFKIPR
jgi:hypothetical protein